ncbi:putative plus-end-directed kinesin ATPase transcription factor bZIP family [Helianthus annuus]|uniref:Kinesin-like protein n=1 Tax=Helianthus annuus TaxID=4232 RepID=A0A251SRH6_HELAN|nr:kinesin-like protein KIN-7K, chloroplastic [Helianthus annuus]KAF5772863.1 putative plus-end-directed kinesin ATPase transcription factor bZIP family [Helianthus annuus]KAJ0476431.1 putative plus-end-directed kinesin ATPase transcription factor bZIP family [Helianthus annuus]KAJ0663267.1 putative plus-end-directed kinesin ATPase transcription factor bZIP family [Helianthus annuus]
MASSHGGFKSRKSTSKYSNSPASSTTSSSKHVPEVSVDNLSSPASSGKSKPRNFQPESFPVSSERSKENVTVTVRFRPLSPREIRQGEEIAWYADGETIVRNEHTPSIAYAYDRVFGPTTTTRHVYDIAAHHVVGGAMEGVNGTIFAYGVTSSGKTHTMHGDQRSPGIIPLAVKDVFSIIQETPSREFLLRVSYLEIYNEVVNDLLNPAGQNLRIREDSQGTFVEGVKEEVVLSPAHALSLIAAGEEHRHVGSTNFNLLSSRSHTIFTLTIESSPCGEYDDGGDVNLSQLNLIDLAGSESSKAETVGVRRKEGSYINKSLLTLGTVISKLTDVRAAHIPYRDSKLTRILQSSLSGHGRVSLICTVTPSSSNSEETHNTLKFAHRAKHIEIQAAQNRIIDEKSLIKKYQNEIRLLKEELEQLKSGIVVVPQFKDNRGDDIVLLKQKLEDGQMKLQSRLEQEEEAKAALLSRIQRLTKLILVSTKSSPSSRLPHRSTLRRRHSFGEEELAYLPQRKRDLILDDENTELYVSFDGRVENNNDALKEEKKTKKPGLLNWLKPRRHHSISGALTSTSDKSSGAKSISTPSTPQADNPTESRHSHSLLTECRSAEFSPGAPQDQELNDDAFLQQESPLISLKTIDQIDLLKEQQKILSEEMAIQLSALKRLSPGASRDSEREFISVEIARLNEQIKLKNDQIKQLEDNISSSVVSSCHKIDEDEHTRSVSELEAQLSEKSFELEVKAGDNRVLQEQLNQKIDECKGLQETINSLKQQLSDARSEFDAEKDAKIMLLRQSQAHEIEKLKEKVTELTESNTQLEARNNKLAEESSYAKGLASAAAVELKALSEEVAKLMNHNEKLSAELASDKNSPSNHRRPTKNGRKDNSSQFRQKEPSPTQSELKRELAISREREMAYEAMLSEKEQIESDLQKTVEESKQREAYLENELANMWVLIAKLKKPQGNNNHTDVSESSHGVDGFDIYGQTKDFV